MTEAATRFHRRNAGWPRTSGTSRRPRTAVPPFAETAMRSGAPGLRKWTVALYMMVTGIKGTASTRAYRSSG